MRLLLIISCVLLCTTSHPRVTFIDASQCKGCHGVARWTAKTDPAMPPNPNDAQPQPVQPATPSQIFKLGRAPQEPLNERSPRTHEEEQWFALRGEVVDVRVEQDGDIHIRLKDVDGSEKDGVVGCEIPLPQGNDPEADELWCQLRTAVFGWTNAKFPFSFGSDKVFKLKKHPVLTITGKCFYDIDHAPKNRSNVRPGTTNYSVWEIHPVMGFGY